MSSFPGARALAVACSLFASVCLSTIASAQATGDYRSAASGNWGAAATWERFNGAIWVAPAPAPPTNADGAITILSPHVVTVEANVSADDATVDVGGKITVSAGQMLTIANGTGIDLNINGTVEVFGVLANSPGALMSSSAATLSFASGGKYQHNSTTNPGAVPAATWNAASTVEFAGYTSNTATPVGLAQTFGNFTWNCPNQSAIVDLGGGLNGATVNGDFTVTSTGTGQLVMASNNVTLAINGNYSQTAGTVNPQSANTRVLTLNMGGNFSLSPGASFTQVGGNASTNVFLNFTKVGTQTFTNAGTMSGRLHYSVGATTTLDMGASVAPGAGNFAVNAGSTLRLGSTAGITTTPTLSGNVQVTGTRTFPTTSHYAYTGAAAQNTGNGLPATVASLTIDNAAGVTLAGSTAVTGAFSATSGALAVGTNTLTLNGGVFGAGSITSAATGTVIYNLSSNGQAVVSGSYGNLTFSNFNKTLPAGTVGIASTFTTGTATGHTIGGSTVDFNGGGAQNIPAFSFHNLTSSNSGARTLGGLIKIAGAFTPGTNAFTITGSTVEYNGAGAQSLPSGFPAYDNLTVNNAAGASLAADVTANGVLTLDNGVVTTGASVLEVAASGSVTRTSGHVNGNLRKTVSGAASSPTFEVGDVTLYAPVNVAFTGVTTPGTLTATTAAGDHGSIATSDLDAAKSVNRSWKMDNAGIVFGTYDITLNFNNPADVDGGASTGAFRVAKLDGSTWTMPPVGAQNSTSTQATGLASFSEFAIGEIDTYTLTYTADPNGSISGTTPQTVAHGADGSPVTAVPNTGYHFVDWSDASTDNPRTDTNVTGDVTVTANFAINTYTLAYAADPNGSITGTTPQTVDHGSDGSPVTAVPNTGYHFVNWSDASTDNPRTDTSVTGDVTVTAIFAINTYTLTYAADPNGSITGTTPQTVDHGADGSPVTAVPNTGYHFVNWSDASTDNPRTDTNVTGDVTVTANFAIDTYTLTYTADANGSISGTTPQTVDHGADGSPVTAVPNTGYHFVNWSDASTDNPRTDTNVTGDITVTANFAINTYTLTYTADANGSITGTTPQTVDHGADGSPVTAVPNTGYHFVNWSDASTDNPRTDTNVTGDITVTANFAINAYTLTVTVVGGGTVDATPPGTSFDHGTSVQLQANPDAGYTFTGWSGDATGVTNPETVVMDGNKAVTATFADQTTPVTQVLAPNGNEALNIGSLTQITWSATDAVGVTLVDIYLSRSGVGGPYETLVTGTANDGTYDWTPTGTGTTVAFVRVVAHDAAGNDGVDESDQAFALIDLTPTMLLLFQTKPLEDGIEVRWEFSDPEMWSSYTLQRAESNVGPWTTLGLEPSREGAVNVVRDRTTTPGRKYLYRLEASTSSGQSMTFGPLWETAGNPIHEFALTSVSPNPTPGSVRIDLAIPRDARVRLSVVDVQGREVASLIDGNLTAGRYQAIWNGESAQGRAQAGVYYLTFDAPGKRTVKPLVVVR